MKWRYLRDLEVSAIGMGCMGFTHAYGNSGTPKEGRYLVHRAFDLGCSFFDTAEMYSYLKNEEFLGQALEGLPRNKVVISDKFWPVSLPGQEEITDKLSETGIRKCLAASMKRLKTDYIDLYTLHMMDENHLEQVAASLKPCIHIAQIPSNRYLHKTSEVS